MTEKELEDLIALRKHISDDFEAVATIVKADSFKELDGLNKDLILTQANAMQTLLGVLSIRIGLNISSVRQPATPATEEPKSEPANEQGTAPEGNKSE